MLRCQFFQRNSGYKSESEYLLGTCGRANSIWKRIGVDVEFFEFRKKKLRIQKCRIRVDGASICSTLRYHFTQSPPSTDKSFLISGLLTIFHAQNHQ